MSKMIFINLPVTDLPASMAFYDAIGFTNNPQFSNERAAAMMWSDTITVMLLTHDFWKTFTTKSIPNAKESAQVALCVNLEGREAVDAITETAGRSGGRADASPPQDNAFMYQRSFEDPDGHNWEPMWMDPKVVSGEVDLAHQPA
ncbi:MAG: VOC family protein [Croceibacterium sp.]